MQLVVCRRCARHVRARDLFCPFCSVSMRRAAGVALTLGASALLLGCNDAQPPPASQADVASLAPPDAAVVASSTASEGALAPDAAADAAPSAPSPSATTDSSASPRADPSNAMMGALYGGPPPGSDTPIGTGTGIGGPTRREVVGDVAVTDLATSVPIPGASATIAGVRSALRRCYDVGLKGDPRMTGNVSFDVKVAPSGEVDSATVVKSTGVSGQVAACMTAAIARTRFAAVGTTESTVTLTAKCSKRTP